MTKETRAQICWYGLLLFVANWALGFLSHFLPDMIYYILKTALLALLFYGLAHRYLHLSIPLKPQVGILEQIRVNCLSLVYLILISPFLLLQGFSENLSALPKALILALGAGFLEEYICRGILLQIAFKDGITSYKQVLEAVLLSSLIFGLAHLGNLRSQSLDVTLFQVYYATAIGIYFSSVVIRTRSLWWTIFIHFMIDFGSVLSTASTKATSHPKLVTILVWLAVSGVALFLIRPQQVQRIVSQEKPDKS